MEAMILVSTVLFICYVAYLAGKRSREKYAQNRDRRALQEMAGKDSGQDSFEGWFVGGRSPHPVSANLEIGYCDAAGNETVRKIHVRQFDPRHSRGMLLAHCHLRKESRSFRVDRIKACVDTDTGEVVTNVLDHLNIRRGAQPDRIKDILARDYRDIVRVVGYMGMADGEFSDSERAVVAEYIRKLTRDPRVDQDVVYAAANKIGKTSLKGFKAAVGRIVNSGGVSPIHLAGCCYDIARADGKVTPEEQEALNYLDRRIFGNSV